MFRVYWWHSKHKLLVNIDGLQRISREWKKKDMAAMLDELTIEANEESFVIVLQYGGNDVTCKWSIYGLHWIPRESNDKDMAGLVK